MFTGLIEEIGIVASITSEKEYARLLVRCPGIREQVKLGDSVAINGACQTAAAFTADGVFFDTLAESLKKTNLGSLQAGSRVNLETSLTVNRGMGGHFVQGHVNGTGTIRSIEKQSQNIFVRIALGGDLLRYCVAEGSITIDGISLTTASIESDCVLINIIPHTFEHTNLADRKIGDRVNIETDILARYVEKFLQSGSALGGGAESPKNTINEERLRSMGYGV